VEREDWVAAHVEPTGPIELVQDWAWSTVWRVPVGDDAVWLKRCKPVQAFEVPLTVSLAGRWPDRMPVLVAHDGEWLLLGDAGRPLRVFGADGLEAWLQVLPLYAELQRGEAAHVAEHLAAGVPDQRLETLPAAYEALLETDVGLAPDELERLRAFAPRFAELCAELRGTPETVQHDDLHDGNVFERDGRFTILDWGDCAITHPFATMLVTFRVIAHVHSLEAGDPWFARLGDAYLEPWGATRSTFDTAQQVAAFSRALTWRRILDGVAPDEDEHPREALPRNLRSFLETVVARSES
jgi:hypothetical protein